MATIEFVDQTLRDGQQANWGMRMQARHFLPIAPTIARVGYRVVDFTGSSIFEVLVKHCREDPWATLRATAAAMPGTRLRAGMRGNAIVGFSLTPHSVLDLWIERLCANGVNSFWIYDVLLNVPAMVRCAEVAKRNGAEVAGSVMYASSPVHTDAYFADKLDALAASPAVDTIYLEDAPGVITPERVATLLPALTAVARGKPFELHFHNTTGLAPLSYLKGIELGARILHTASTPLANGPSMPSTQVMVRNVVGSGHSHELDLDALAEVSAHFDEVCERESLPRGVVREYDVTTYSHQIPGGMQGTLRNQLRQHGLEHRLSELLDEAARVRQELGYPGMATPFSQLVGTQALMNLLGGERYALVPDEVIIYALGHLGPPPAPIDPDVLDRITSSPRGCEFARWTPPQPTLAELRHRFPRGISDDELLLRILMPGTDVDAMLAAGPPVTEPEGDGADVFALAKTLLTGPARGSIDLRSHGGRVSLAAR